jgi:hypothetical protein
MDAAAYVEKITLPWSLAGVPSFAQVTLIGYEAPSVTYTVQEYEPVTLSALDRVNLSSLIYASL